MQGLTAALETLVEPVDILASSMITGIFAERAALKNRFLGSDSITTTSCP